jgi:hypothetical protein
MRGSTHGENLSLYNFTSQGVLKIRKASRVGILTIKRHEYGLVDKRIEPREKFGTRPPSLRGKATTLEPVEYKIQRLRPYRTLSQADIREECDSGATPVYFHPC